MKDRSNKTIMCSVLFLDIMRYSRETVSEQISLRERFNNYLSEAINDVPITDRIILDTGDGAAIGFFGDVEDALKVALVFRDGLLNPEAEKDRALVLRIGINLGPVRLVKDINNQPNIVGDGINDAQRVMSFADSSQILVSRSYFDAVRRLSPQYSRMFHFQGLLTDKHVREHEVYSIGYPPVERTRPGIVVPMRNEQANKLIPGIMNRSGAAWGAVFAWLNAHLNSLLNQFWQAELKRRFMYVALIVLFLLLTAVVIYQLIPRPQLEWTHKQ